MKNVGCVQQLHSVAAGGARCRRQPYTVAEDDGGGAAEVVRGEEPLRSVGGGRRACPARLYPPERVAVSAQVNYYTKTKSLSSSLLRSPSKFLVLANH